MCKFLHFMQLLLLLVHVQAAAVLRTHLGPALGLLLLLLRLQQVREDGGLVRADLHGRLHVRGCGSRRGKLRSDVASRLSALLLPLLLLSLHAGLHAHLLHVVVIRHLRHSRETRWHHTGESWHSWISLHTRSHKVLWVTRWKTRHGTVRWWWEE